MKKIIFIILTVVLVLALGIIYYQIKIAKLPIERVIPEQAIFYVRVSGIEESLQEFKTTRLWWNIRDIDVQLLLEKSGLNQDEIAQFNIYKPEFFRTVSELLLNKFFGQELALALYPNKISTFEDPEALLDIASNIVLVTRLAPEAEFIEFVSKLLNKCGQKFQTKLEEYKGHQITIVKLTDKLSFAYVKIRDMLVVSLGKKLVIACLDVVAGDKSSLSKDKDYISTVSQFPRSSQTIAYGNLESFCSNLRRLINILPESEQIPAEQKVRLLESFDKIAGLKTLGISSVSGKISSNKVVLTFDKAEMDPAIARACSFKPQKNITINFAPKDIIIYQWSNCFDAKMSWDNFQQELSKRPKEFTPGPSPEDIITGIEEELGKSIESDIIPALSNEIGGFLSDINLDGPVPIPEIVFFVKTKDKSAIKSIIDTLTEKNNLSVQPEEYKDIRIKYILLPFGRSFQPGYCFLDEYLLISTRPKLLKESIDSYNDKSISLAANKDFQAIDFGLTEKNNAAFFLKTDVLLRKVRGVCEWGVSWLSLMSTTLEAYQQKAEQYLDNLRRDIQIEQLELKSLKDNLQLTKEEQEITNLQAKIKEKEEKINLAKKDLEEKEQELENMIQNSPVAKIDLSLVRLYLDDVVYPILDGLETNKAIGSRSIFSENTVEAQTFFKVEE